MPPRAAIDRAATFGERLPAAFAYPLDMAALTSIVAIALAHYLSLAPVLGLVFEAICWAAIYQYAFACLRHTADGYADPPEFAGEGSGGAAFVLIAVQVVGILYVVMLPSFFGPLALAIGLAIGFFLPAIAMSLAFGDSALAALNPLNWLRTVANVGMPYVLLAVIYLGIAALQLALQTAVAGLLPRLLAMLVYYLLANYATVLNFHLMGAMIHAHADRFGYSPQAGTDQQAFGVGADDELLRTVQARAAGDRDGAIDLLTERLREGLAPADVHAEYRRLLALASRHDELLVHGQIWIAALIVAGDLRKALGVVQECQAIDPRFVPDDPRTAGPLAEKAHQLGMPRLAAQLAQGYVQRWPREYEAPYYGLMAARVMIAGHRQAEAMVLLSRLRDAWPDHPLATQLDALIAGLGGTPRALKDNA
jgi:hypothetical protein